MATEENVNRYVELDHKIRMLENKKVRQPPSPIKKRFEQMTAEVKRLSQKYEKCKQNTAKEKADVVKVEQNADKLKAELTKAGYEKSLGKEQAEYIEALTQEENAKKELDSANEQLKKLNEEMKKESPTEGVEELEKLCAEQEELLSKIFDGAYGSDLENKLESDLNMHQEKRERVGVAKYKWSNGKVLLQHACTQLATACKKWNDILDIPSTNTQMRYSVATEARNNLIAAKQNLESCQNYLDTIDFPYCKPAEVSTLEKATNNIYIDMQSNDRHKHALNCYSVTQKRASALLQWFDTVINGTIEKDLLQVTKLESETAKALRTERIRLLKEKVESGGGQVDTSKLDLDDGPFKLAPDSDEEQDSVVFALVGDEQTCDEQVPGQTPVPLSELAPPPSDEMIFGNIEQLKKQHEKEKSDYQKAQEMNKARLEQGLQEKLAARRHRRKQAQ